MLSLIDEKQCRIERVLWRHECRSRLLNWNEYHTASDQTVRHLLYGVTTVMTTMRSVANDAVKKIAEIFARSTVKARMANGSIKQKIHFAISTNAHAHIVWNRMWAQLNVNYEEFNLKSIWGRMDHFSSTFERISTKFRLVR